MTGFTGFSGLAALSVFSSFIGFSSLTAFVGLAGLIQHRHEFFARDSFLFIQELCEPVQTAAVFEQYLLSLFMLLLYELHDLPVDLILSIGGACE